MNPFHSEIFESLPIPIFPFRHREPPSVAWRSRKTFTFNRYSLATLAAPSVSRRAFSSPRDDGSGVFLYVLNSVGWRVCPGLFSLS